MNHTGFDNTAFLTEDKIVFVEDAGDTLHTQRNAFDSAFLFDLHTDYSNPQNRRAVLARGEMRQPWTRSLDSLSTMATTRSQVGTFRWRSYYQRVDWDESAETL
jgi:hypothetical protein